MAEEILRQAQGNGGDFPLLAPNRRTPLVILYQEIVQGLGVEPLCHRSQEADNNVGPFSPSLALLQQFRYALSTLYARMPPDIDEFIGLLNGSLDLATVVQSVLFAGTPFVFEGSPDTWNSVRSKLAGDLGSEEEGIFVVGSAKMGYSLAPHKYGREFGDHSDIDVIVIDADLYDRVWLSILRWHYRRRHQLPPADRRWDAERRDGLYWGYLNPVGFRYRSLSRSRQLNPARDVSTNWFNAFQALGLLPELAGRNVGGRLYRTLKHAILYHDHGLRQLRVAASNRGEP